MKTRIKFRLKGTPDADLIGLRHWLGPDFDIEVKRALKSFVKGQKSTIRLPSDENSDKDKTIDLSSTQIYLVLDDEIDADVIDWIFGIKEGFRQVVIKAVIRNFLPEPYVFDMYKASPVRLLTTTKRKGAEIPKDQLDKRGEDNTHASDSQAVKTPKASKEVASDEAPPQEQEFNIFDSDFVEIF